MYAFREGEGVRKKRTFCTLVNNGDNWTSRLTLNPGESGKLGW